ncbi:MAG: hypothetical protein GY774_02440 [Planctomycetes bacterium]|nr:hypothetical protein [Planctomycetota bacterium]
MLEIYIEIVGSVISFLKNMNERQYKLYPLIIHNLLTIFIILSICVFFTSCVKQDSDDILDLSHVNNDLSGEFPLLEPNALLPTNYQWIYQEGAEDFHIYWASSKEDDTSFIGIYFGLHPQFESSDNHKKIEGKVANKPVIWQIENKKEINTLIRETVLPYKHGTKYLTLNIHIWVHAKTKEKMEAFLKVLEFLEFEVKKES